MNDDDDRDLRGTCRAARPLIHERMDRTLTADEHARLETHLATCSDCREFADGLDGLRRALRELPEASMPDSALERVWARTVDARPWWQRAWPASGSWMRPALVGAASLLLTGVALWVGLAGGGFGSADPARPSRAEVAEAAREARYALTLASVAMRRTQRAAVNEVLQGEVAPALDRVPIRWPDSAASGRNGT